MIMMAVDIRTCTDLLVMAKNRDVVSHNMENIFLELSGSFLVYFLLGIRFLVNPPFLFSPAKLIQSKAASCTTLISMLCSNIL